VRCEVGYKMRPRGGQGYYADSERGGGRFEVGIERETREQY
jgi:hypothetical protein